MKEEFEIRTMGFNELAQYYLPHIQPASASIRLSSWIKQHQVLSEKLRSPAISQD